MMPRCPQYSTGRLKLSARQAGTRLTGRVRLYVQLRLNKVSELIHNSTHHQDVPMARVSVHFMEIIDKVRRF